MSDDKMTAWSGYGDFAQQYEAAYTAFSSTYVLRNPPPQKPKREFGNLRIQIMLGVMLIAQVWVSGSRTIAEFGDVGIPAFIMLEVGMVTFAFIRTSLSYDKARHENIMRWISAGMMLAFAVMIASNLDSTLSKHFDFPPIVDLIIQIAIAISAPVLAFINGDVLGMYAARELHIRKAQAEKYEAEYKAYSERLAKAWDSKKSEWGVKIEVVREPVRIHSERSLPEHVNEYGEQGVRIHSGERAVNAANGYTKNMNASDAIREFMNANSERSELWSMTANEFHAELLNAGLKVGRTKAYEIRKQLQEVQP